MILFSAGSIPLCIISTWIVDRRAPSLNGGASSKLARFEVPGSGRFKCPLTPNYADPVQEAGPRVAIPDFGTV
jgi:hypothetical protein